MKECRITFLGGREKWRSFRRDSRRSKKERKQSTWMSTTAASQSASREQWRLRRQTAKQSFMNESIKKQILLIAPNDMTIKMIRSGLSVFIDLKICAGPVDSSS